ncbi:MAG TPA: hypothetical protein VFZ53_19855 [Polyangiaceae bacterium]
MKSSFFAVFIGLVTSAAIAGCALDSGTGTDEVSTSDGTQNTGTVRLDLQGQAQNGTIYRLRQATFAISTTPPLLLSSDGANATLTQISQTLSPGSYLVTLQNGWVLDKVVGATATPVQATLTSSQSQMFGISAGSSTNVTYQFQTNGLTVTTGTLNIGIGVTETDGGAPSLCTPPCIGNTWCGPSPMGSATCLTPGSSPLNGMCTTAPMGVTCAANLVCVTSPGSTSGLCKSVCSPGVPNSCPMGACTPYQNSMLFGTCP